MTESARPILHLSGEKLRAALEQLIAAAEPIGGIERFAGAVKLRAEIIHTRVGDCRAATVERAAFDDIAVLMPTVRRRIGPLIEALGWPVVRGAMATLLHDAQVPGTADRRVKAFEAALPSFSPSPFGKGEKVAEGRMRGSGPTVGNRSDMTVPAVRLIAAQAAAPHPPFGHPLPHQVAGERGNPPRFLRDLAAELLHAAYPEHYPLMTRWVWDAGANTGALREIWHDPATSSDDVDHIIINVSDTHETFLVLREELSQFLSQSGVFRDMIWYVDLLLAQVYAIYITAQGGVYLKADFQVDGDPLEHTRRILGLDKKAIAQS